MKTAIATLFHAFWIFAALSEHVLACDSEAACLEGYAKAMVERSEPADLAAAEEALRQGCAQAETGKSCRILSWLMYRGVFAGDFMARFEVTAQGCEAGDYTACNRLSEHLLAPESWEVPRSETYVLHRGWIERECADGNDYACRKLVRYVNAEDAARYTARCDAGETVFCALLGGPHIYPFYEDKAGAGRAEDIFRQTCEAGEGMSCLFLADLITSGHGRDFNETARAHVERACDLGLAHGCNVARDYMLRDTPEASTDERMRYLQPSCEAGHAPACVLIAELERWNSDDTKIRYAQVLHEDCLSGNWQSCEAAAYAFEAVRYHMDLAGKYDDVDQFIQNYFDLAELLKGQ